MKIFVKKKLRRVQTLPGKLKRPQFFVQTLNSAADSARRLRAMFTPQGIEVRDIAACRFQDTNLIFSRSVDGHLAVSLTAL